MQFESDNQKCYVDKIIIIGDYRGTPCRHLRKVTSKAQSGNSSDSTAVYIPPDCLYGLIKTIGIDQFTFLSFDILKNYLPTNTYIYITFIGQDNLNLYYPVL